MKELLLKTTRKINNNKILLMPLFIYYLIGPLIIGLRRSLIPLANANQVDRLSSFILLIPLLMIVKTASLALWSNMIDQQEDEVRSFFKTFATLFVQNIIVTIAFLPFIIWGWYLNSLAYSRYTIFIYGFCALLSLPILIFRLRTNRHQDLLNGLKMSFSFSSKHLTFSLFIILLSILFQGSFWMFSQISILKMNSILKMLLLVIPRSVGLTFIITLAYEYVETHLPE